MDSMFSNLGTMIMLVVALPFVLVVVFLVYLALRSGRRAGVSKSWPTTMGRVVTATVEMRRSHSSEGGYSTSHYPQVIYEYTVNGQKYMGNKINFGMEVGYGWASMAERIIARYPVGGMIPVYYDPNDPVQAVLERTSGTSSRLLVGVAVVILVILGVTVLFTAGINSLVTSVTSALPR